MNGLKCNEKYLYFRNERKKMKIKWFDRIKGPNGIRHIYFCGIKVWSYRKAGHICADLTKNHIEIPSNNSSSVKIDGTDNTIIFDSDCDNVNLSISIYGNHNRIHVKKSGFIRGNVTIGLSDTHTENCSLNIGKNVNINGVNILMAENETNISIGDDCLFSDCIEFWASDTHTLLDDNGKVINIGKSIKIGKHVWIGKHVKVLKNTEISDNSVVGMASVVTKRFTQSNCAIAGNPAKVVKQNINWDISRPSVYK